jgi:hypothetical protein
MLGDAVKTMNTTDINQALAMIQAHANPGSSMQSLSPSVAAMDNTAIRNSAQTIDPAAIEQTTASPLPTAVPIYDAARDAGTLVVNNLPKTNEGETYNLWVTTGQGAEPIYVGSLPASNSRGTDSFDFSLGSTAILPSGFLLTKDLKDKPSAPTTANTVLQGPPPNR